MEKLNDKVLVWTKIDSLEEEAKQQLKNISEMPFVFKHVAVMPDCHVGKGATVGTVLATRDAIIPAAVGVDIGCGMIAVRTNLKKEQLDGKLKDIRLGIERRIPIWVNSTRKLPHLHKRGLMSWSYLWILMMI